MDKEERFDFSKKEISCERYHLGSALISEKYNDFYLDVIEDPEEEGLFGGWIFHKDFDTKMLATELVLDQCGDRDEMMHIMLNQILSARSLEAYREFFMEEEDE